MTPVPADAAATSAKYRPDIDGMRAVAVIAVLLFHLELTRFQGGYVGVDVFYVISGFLITALILEKALEGTFRFAAFYQRRIRRLVPPLIATVAVTAIAASVILLPDDMGPFAGSAIAALGSFSNIVFFTESGYWDTAAELKPLLHTWSLGVEEQFYLIWPALVVGLVALRRRVPLVVSVAAVTVIGLVAALWMHAIDPVAAFYLFPFRIFQFGVGALVGLLPSIGPRSARGKDLVFLVGILMVVGAVVLYDAATSFPGLAALPPTLGTVLLMVAGTRGQGRLGRPLLESSGAVWIGRVSYSMYLAHWPIITLYRYRTGLALTAPEQLALAALTLLGTLALHHGVERRFYRRGAAAAGGRTTVSPAHFTLRTVAVSAGVAAVMALVVVGDGWAWRFPNLLLSPEAIRTGMDDRFELIRDGCSLRAIDNRQRCHLERPVQVLVLGNSHEPDGFNFIAGGFGADPDVNLMSFGTTNDCPGLVVSDAGWRSDNANCQRRLDSLFAIAQDLDVVVYAANRPYAADKGKFLELVAWITERAPAARVVTLGGYINLATPCPRLVNMTGSTGACADPGNVEYFEDDPSRFGLYDEVLAMTDVYVDRVALLCTDRKVETCATESSGGVPMSFDQHHLSLEFSLEAGQRYAAGHPDLLQPSGT